MCLIFNHHGSPRRLCPHHLRLHVRPFLPHHRLLIGVLVITSTVTVIVVFIKGMKARIQCLASPHGFCGCPISMLTLQKNSSFTFSRHSFPHPSSRCSAANTPRAPPSSHSPPPSNASWQPCSCTGFCPCRVNAARTGGRVSREAFSPPGQPARGRPARAVAGASLERGSAGEITNMGAGAALPTRTEPVLSRLALSSQRRSCEHQADRRLPFERERGGGIDRARDSLSSLSLAPRTFTRCLPFISGLARSNLTQMTACTTACTLPTLRSQAPSCRLRRCGLCLCAMQSAACWLHRENA